MVAQNATLPTRGPTGSSEELLSTAERLFAARGVENVALTEIVAASGQRNRSALHYHFGSRDGVLTAVLNRRLASINARREAALDALPAQPTLAEIIRATLSPLVDVVETEPWGRDYVAILAQVIFHPQLLGRSAVDDALLTSVRRARRLLIAAAPGAPAEIIARRLGWLNETVVFALARWAHEGPGGAPRSAAVEELIRELTTYGAAALAASAPSRETET